MWSKVVESGICIDFDNDSGRKGKAELTIQQNPTSHDVEQLQISTSFVALGAAVAKMKAGQQGKPVMANKCFAAITQLASTKRDG